LLPLAIAQVIQSEARGPTGEALDGAVDLIKANYLTIIAELVKLNKLRKA
jgi:hypothetical protein